MPKGKTKTPEELQAQIDDLVKKQGELAKNKDNSDKALKDALELVEKSKKEMQLISDAARQTGSYDSMAAFLKDGTVAPKPLDVNTDDLVVDNIFVAGSDEQKFFQSQMSSSIMPGIKQLIDTNQSKVETMINSVLGGVKTMKDQIDFSKGLGEMGLTADKVETDIDFLNSLGDMTEIDRLKALQDHNKKLIEDSAALGGALGEQLTTGHGNVGNGGGGKKDENLAKVAADKVNEQAESMRKSMEAS